MNYEDKTKVLDEAFALYKVYVSKINDANKQNLNAPTDGFSEFFNLVFCPLDEINSDTADYPDNTNGTFNNINQP